MPMTLTTRNYIILKTLPWLFLVVLVAAGAMYWVADYQVQQQLEEKHHNHIQRFEDHFNDTLNNLANQLNSIATNDLVINALVDLQARDSYLPIFIDSYELARLPGVGLTMHDFAGEVIYSKYKATTIPTTQDKRWTLPVLEQGQGYQHLDVSGLTLVEPVLYANLPEGALSIFVSMDRLRPLFEMEFGASQVTVTAPDQTVIMSTPVAANYADRPEYQSDDWVRFEKVIDNGFLVSSTEPVSIAREDMQWIQLGLVLGISISILLTVLSTFMSSRLTSNAINRFSQALNHIRIGKRQILSDDSTAEPLEFQQLRASFVDLMRDLESKTVSTERFDSILNSMTELLVVFDRHQKVLLHNQPFKAFAEEVGLTDETAFDSIVPLDTRTIVFEPHLDIADTSRTYQRLGEDDEACVIRWSRRIFTTEESNTDGVVFVGVDITDSLKIEQELRVKNLAIEEASSSIVISDVREPNMPMVYINKAFEELTGYTREEVLGRNCRFLQGPETSQSAIERIRQGLKLGGVLTETLLNYRKDGSYFYNELALSPIFNNAGQITHYLGIQSDVTKRIEAESFLKMAKDEAERSTQMKSEFLASMSHEIRTPMNGVLGMLGLLGDTSLNEEQRKYVQLGQSSAKSLLVLINDILDFSKIEAGKLQIDAVHFDLQALFNDVIDTMAFRARDKNLDLLLDISEITHDMVTGDPGRLRQILTNLISNAIKFTSAGRVIVKASLEEIGANAFKLICEVHDTGIGIPKTKLNKLFDAFTQVDASTTRSFGGTGLGLAIVKQLSQLMQGDVSVVSEVGEGSTFTFSIELERSSAIPVIPQKGILKGKRIVLVHEPGNDLKVIADMLESLGLEVVSVSTAKEAIALLRDTEKQPDLAVISNELDGISGENLGKAINTDKAIAHIPLVLITARGEQGQSSRASDIGFVGFLTKPISQEQFRAAIAQVLEISRTPQKNAAMVTRHNLYNPKQTPAMRGHVLLAEDNEINQVVAKTMLENMGLRVTIAETGQAALERMAISDNDPFDIVLMDCQMPTMDGYEATRAIRRGMGGESYQLIPIVALTAHAMTDDRKKCLAAGMNDYISKPIDPVLFAEKLMHWMAKSTARQETI